MENYSNYHNANIIGLSKVIYKIHFIGNHYSKKKNIPNKLIYVVLVTINRFLNFKLGCHVPFKAEIGKSLVLPHGFFGIFISKYAKIGNNCCVFHQVTIGSNFHTSSNPGAPKIGDNVLIGAGAKIIGNISIGDNVKIGANAIVTNDVESGKTIVSPKAIVL
jgi:serine acetyltransferase